MSKASYFTMDLKLKNVGQTAAVDVEAELFFEQALIPSGNRVPGSNRKVLQSLGPGVERVVQLSSKARNSGLYPPPQLKYPPTFLFYGSIWTTDDTTRERRREDWCYFLKLRTEQDRDATKLELCDSNTYKPDFPQ